MQAKDEVDEEVLHAMEEDMTGKVYIFHTTCLLMYDYINHLVSQILLASWRGTRFEVVQVLREVSLVSA